MYTTNVYYKSLREITGLQQSANRKLFNNSIYIYIFFVQHSFLPQNFVDMNHQVISPLLVYPIDSKVFQISGKNIFTNTHIYIDNIPGTIY